MKLTIGLACFNNYTETWFTVQALRMYQDLTDTEILIIDNFGSDQLEAWVNGWGNGQVRYVRYTDKQSPTAGKNRIFEEAKGKWVLVIDSHVMLQPGTIARFKQWAESEDSNNLFHGPLIYDQFTGMADSMNDEIGTDGLWGTWHNATVDPEAEPYEIKMHGMGLFACKRSAWLGFNDNFKGFGGEEGYIHCKFRNAGRKVILLPWLGWMHFFNEHNRPYKIDGSDRLRNHLIGFMELGLDLKPIVERYGKPTVFNMLKEIML